VEGEVLIGASGWHYGHWPRPGRARRVQGSRIGHPASGCPRVPGTAFRHERHHKTGPDEPAPTGRSRNVYSDELSFQSGLHPKAKAAGLDDAELGAPALATYHLAHLLRLRGTDGGDYEQAGKQMLEDLRAAQKRSNV
jgi:hypothetical protein